MLGNCQKLGSGIEETKGTFFDLTDATTPLSAGRAAARLIFDFDQRSLVLLSQLNEK